MALIDNILFVSVTISHSNEKFRTILHERKLINTRQFHRRDIVGCAEKTCQVIWKFRGQVIWTFRVEKDQKRTLSNVLTICPSPRQNLKMQPIMEEMGVLV
mmetsp:Transcript_50415/g.98611  ORF Transcript_50415/g.98611 Transcript_50415/m.98611 type:complete len:101 (+) Transcript_50415:663-965(+)